MKTIAHESIKSDKMVVGSSIIEFNENGLASVPDDIAENIKGLKGFSIVEEGITDEVILSSNSEETQLSLIEEPAVGATEVVGDQINEEESSKPSDEKVEVKKPVRRASKTSNKT